MAKKASCINKNLETLKRRYTLVPIDLKQYVDEKKLFSEQYTLTWLGREAKQDQRLLNFYMFKRHDYSQLNDSLNKMVSLEETLDSKGVGTSSIKSFNKLTWMDLSRESNEIEGMFKDFDIDLNDFRKELRFKFDIKDEINCQEFECQEYYEKLFKKIEEFSQNPTLLIIKGKTEEHQVSLELARHYIAFRYAFDCAKYLSTNQERLTPLIFKSVAKNIADLLTGVRAASYRNQQVYVNLGNYDIARWIPVKTEKVLSSLDCLAEWVVKESRLNPIEKAAITQAEYIRIHPYMDGNGRISRILTNFVLMYNGLPTIRLRYNETDRYFKGLNKAIEEHNCDDLIDLFYESELESSKEVSACYKKIMNSEAKTERAK